MKFYLYSVWGDPMFYAAAAVFALGMFSLVFSIRKYLEMKNRSGMEESEDEEEETRQGELPLGQASDPSRDGSGAELTEPESGVAPGAEDGGEGQGISSGAGGGVPSFGPEGPGPSSKAEEFVKGLYQSMSDMDARLKNIEAVFSKNSVNKDFTVTFLEDMISDFDSLDKEKIKARIEYLVSDLKK